MVRNKISDGNPAIFRLNNLQRQEWAQVAIKLANLFFAATGMGSGSYQVGELTLFSPDLGLFPGRYSRFWLQKSLLGGYPITLHHYPKVAGSTRTFRRTAHSHVTVTITPFRQPIDLESGPATYMGTVDLRQ